MKHNICVVGGSGFVGKYIVSALAAEGHSVRVLTRHRERHRELLVLPTVQVINADIHDQQQLQQHFAAQDTVINLVGILNERRDNGKGFHRVHVELSEKIVKACQSQQVQRLLHMSALNADAKGGRSYYLRSKGEAEDRVHQAQNLLVTSFRPSVIFGPGDSFVNRFAGLLASLPWFFPLACGNSRFAPIYVGDVAQVFLRSLDNPHTFGQRYNLCGPHSYSLQQLVRNIAVMLGKHRVVISLGRVASLLQANILEYLPGKPFSRDNYRSLQVDSVCAEGSTLLSEVFDITPTTMEAAVPRYLLNKTARQHYAELRRHLPPSH